MLNYLRYLIALILFGSLFYTYQINIPEETITNAIDKKLPMVINKKGFDINITEITVDEVSKSNIVSSTIKGTLKMNNDNIIHKKSRSFIGKFFNKDKADAIVNKKYNLIIKSKAKPQLEGATLSFKVKSLEVKGLMKIKKVNGVIQRKLENIKIPIKKLEALSLFASTKNIKFDIDGSLIVGIGINPWLILLLIPIFLLREIGLILISFYQKFLSPRKGYSCAKNHVNKNGTCSSSTKQAFKDDGFIAGMKEYRSSTKECKVAYKSLENKRNSKGDACDVAVCAGCDGLSASEGIAGGASGFGECSSGAGECGSGMGDCGAGGCDIGAC